jgi:hypothetical protein
MGTNAALLQMTQLRVSSINYMTFFVRYGSIAWMRPCLGCSYRVGYDDQPERPRIAQTVARVA